MEISASPQIPESRVLSGTDYKKELDAYHSGIKQPREVPQDDQAKLERTFKAVEENESADLLGKMQQGDLGVSRAINHARSLSCSESDQSRSIANLLQYAEDRKKSFPAWGQVIEILSPSATTREQIINTYA